MSMTSLRALSVAVFLCGLAMAASFHASGALDVEDAEVAATLREGVAGSPPGPLTSRGLGLGVDLARLVHARVDLFRAMHLSAGVLLAIAAALSARLVAGSAGRFPDAPVGPGLGAGLAVGVATLLGADLGTLGLKGGPLPVLLVLLAGAAAAWTASVPRAFWGGLLLGAATAEHPVVLFLLPGFGGLAMGAPLRIPPNRSGGFLRRAMGGFVLGLLALALPVLDSAGHPLLDFGDPETPARAVRLWWGGDDPAWSPVSPGEWGRGLVETLAAVWRNLGPIGIVLAYGGLFAFFSGRASRLRPFLLVHGILVIANIVGDFRFPGLVDALLGWSLLFWIAPAMMAVHARLDGERPPWRSPALALLLGGTLLFLNAGTIDRSAERGVDWARCVLEPLPPDAVLITRNPVHVALAADGLRSDVDVVYVPEPSSLRARREGRTLPVPELPPGREMSGPYLHELVNRLRPSRPVALAPGLFFDRGISTPLLGTRWSPRPFGLAFLIEPSESKGDPELSDRAAGIWDPLNVIPGSPESPLRDGLRGSEYYARGLMQSASLHLDQGRLDDAEREFLAALSHPDANRPLVAFGLGQVFLKRDQRKEALQVLEDLVRDGDANAWIPCRLLAETYFLVKRDEEGVAALERALRLVPPENRREIESMTKNLERRRAILGARTDG
jgi:hypothetical protein